MSADLDSLRAAAKRLEEIAAELSDKETSDSRAAELAKEAAELAATAGTTAANAVRAAGEGSGDNAG